MDFLIFLTYVAQTLGVVAIVLGFVMLVRSGPPSEAGSTTYWLGDEQISRAEFEDLSRPVTRSNPANGENQ